MPWPGWELHRLEGAVHAAADDHDAARRFWWELRATTRSRHELRNEIETLIALFTEEFDTPDLLAQL